MLKLLKNLAPFAPMVLLIFIFMFAQAIAELNLPNLMSDMINNGMIKGDTGYILRTGGIMLLVALGSTIASFIGSYISAKAAMGFGRNIRSKIFTKVENFSLRDFESIGTASLITRTTNDITQVQTALVMMFRFIIYAPIMCVGGILMAVAKDGDLTNILLVVLPLMIVSMLIIAFNVMPLFKSLQKKLDHLNLVLRENLMGIRVIRAFNKLLHEKKRFGDANKELTDLSIKVNKIMAIMQPFMIIFMNMTVIAIIWFSSVRISNDQMNIGNMMAFMQYAMQIMFSIIMVTIMFVMIPRAQASAVRINEVLEVQSEQVEAKNPITPQTRSGKVEFRNVVFSYDEAEAPALNDISFSAKPGETTAIIGGTGSGKSTLISLIPRFYELNEGQILVDDVDITEMDSHELRKRIGFVPQSAILFTGSVADNIRFGKDDATDEEIRQAARIAQAEDFIMEMPEGFESPISQGGTNVSGGQKQRLSIARAVVRRPDIYIFDDSFSALDFKTDAKLRKALKSETTASTVIIVAQRVSTIMHADKIIVLDEGKIVGMGTHKELLKTCEIYHEIVSSQLSEEEIA